MTTGEDKTEGLKQVKMKAFVTASLSKEFIIIFFLQQETAQRHYKKYNKKARQKKKKSPAKQQ